VSWESFAGHPDIHQPELSGCRWKFCLHDSRLAPQTGTSQTMTALSQNPSAAQRIRWMSYQRHEKKRMPSLLQSSHHCGAQHLQTQSINQSITQSIPRVGKCIKQGWRCLTRYSNDVWLISFSRSDPSAKFEVDTQPSIQLPATIMSPFTASLKSEVDTTFQKYSGPQKAERCTHT